VRALDRPDRQLDVVVAEQRAGVRHPPGGQGPGDHVQGLGVPGPRLAGVDAEVGQLIRADPTADPDVQPAVGELVQDGDLLGQAQRFVGRQHVDQGTDPQPGRALAQRGQEQVRRRADRQRCAVVLGDVVVADAGRLGRDREVQPAGDHRPGGRIAQVEGVEDPEAKAHGRPITRLLSPAGGYVRHC
jgi:hypothetical protein